MPSFNFHNFKLLSEAISYSTNPSTQVHLSCIYKIILIYLHNVAWFSSNLQSQTNILLKTDTLSFTGSHLVLNLGRQVNIESKAPWHHHSQELTLSD